MHISEFSVKVPVSEWSSFCREQRIVIIVFHVKVWQLHDIHTYVATSYTY